LNGEGRGHENETTDFKMGILLRQGYGGQAGRGERKFYRGPQREKENERTGSGVIVRAFFKAL
jgi:hypothetical protein